MCWYNGSWMYGALARIVELPLEPQYCRAILRMQRHVPSRHRWQQNRQHL